MQRRQKKCSMIMKTKIYTVILIIFCVVNNLGAQDSGNESYKFTDNWSINVNFGSSLFWGDLRVNDVWPVDKNQNERKWAYGIVLGKRINPLLEIRTQFLFGELSGTKRTEKQYFNTDYLEYNIHTTFDFVNLIYGYKPDRKLNFYALLGVGSFQYRSIKRELGTQKILATAGWNTNATVKENYMSELVFPLGLGGRFSIDRRFSVTGDVIWKYTNTDLIDLTEGKSKHDLYSYMSLGVTYRFNFSRNNREMFKKESGSTAAKKNCDKVYVFMNTKLDSIGNEVKIAQNNAKNLEAENNRVNKSLDSLKNLNIEKENKLKQLQADLNTKSNDTDPIGNKATNAFANLQGEGLIIYTKDGKVYISMDEKLLFAPGSWNLSEEGIKALHKLAQVLEKYPNVNVMIEGHTDNIAFNGSSQIKDNWDLSVMRATAIAKIILKNANIDAQRITVSGHGEFLPIVPNNSKENRAKNRRTEIILIPK